MKHVLLRLIITVCELFAFQQSASFARDPVSAPRPASTVLAVQVDLIVINRHRQVRKWEELDHRLRVVKKRKFTETWWVSFWDAIVVPSPAGGILFADIVDRGWWPGGDTLFLQRCSTGFCIGQKSARPGAPRLVVFARSLCVVDSPFDYEVKNRRFYQPIQAR